MCSVATDSGLQPESKQAFTTRAPFVLEEWSLCCMFSTKTIVCCFQLNQDAIVLAFNFKCHQWEVNSIKF